MIGMEEGAVYTEEVTADTEEVGEIITSDMVTDDIEGIDIPPGAQIVQIQRKDANGQIHLIPILVAPSELLESDVQESEVSLATASIM